MTRCLLLVLLTLAVVTSVTGCSSVVRLPMWHDTAVFADPSAIVSPQLETPLKLRPLRVDDRRWVVQTPVITPRRPDGFDQAIGSWNIHVAAGAAAAIDISVNDGAGWSPRLRLGHVGNPSLLDSPQRAIDPADPARGVIDTDYFVSSKPWRSAQFTVTLVSTEGAMSPPGTVERLALCLSRVGETAPARTAHLVNPVRRMRVTNEVPFRTQRTSNPALSGRLCSPTSLSMVLAFHGVDQSVESVASRVHDAEFDLYGNWPRNVQAAFELGVPGFVTRLSDWTSAAAHLERGEPLIVSIRAPRGVIRNAPYRSLDGGHLIVLTGLDGQGGVFVNDSAAGTAADGQRTYAMSDLSKAWLELGRGTAYVLLPRPRAASSP